MCFRRRGRRGSSVDFVMVGLILLIPPVQLIVHKTEGLSAQIVVGSVIDQLVSYIGRIF